MPLLKVWKCLSDFELKTTKKQWDNHTDDVAQLTGAADYTDCISAEG